MRHHARRHALAAAALLIALAPVWHVGAPPVDAAISVSRQAGADRFATAVQISRAAFGTGVPVAFIATGSDFPDALAGGPLAARLGGPVLLTTRTGLPDVTRTELGRLKPGRIVILGGTGSVAGSVATALDAYTAGSVTRLAGGDRYATSVAISKAGFAAGVPAVYIATAGSFPDALAASAAAARGRYPVLLVGRNAIPDVVAAELRRLRPGRIFVAGGVSAVSEVVRAALAQYAPGGATRVAGPDRFATAVAVSKRHFTTAPIVYLASGRNYPDALAAAPVAGRQGGPVLLTAPDYLPSVVAAEIARLKPGKVVIVGGTNAVSPSVAAAVAAGTAPLSGSGRCTARPTSAPAGWRRVVASDFNETTALGRWPGPVAAQHWVNRAAGARDSSGRGVYDSSKTVSERNGLLDIWIHSETAARPGVHDPAGQRYVAAIVAKMGPTNGARISICMRADVIPGYKLAYMLWPSQGTGNELGEIDYPEARLIGPPATAKAFMHYAPKPSSGSHQDAYDSGASLQAWHVYTMEWNPKAATPYVSFYLDGRRIGHSTRYVPAVAMRYIMQMETFVGGQALPAPAQGHIQVDWVTIDLP